jgi:hypothetical protein
LLIPTSNTTTPPFSPKRKKITFVGASGGFCDSPPCDRKPNGFHVFKKCASHMNNILRNIGLLSLADSQKSFLSTFSSICETLQDRNNILYQLVGLYVSAQNQSLGYRQSNHSINLSKINQFIMFFNSELKVHINSNDRNVNETSSSATSTSSHLFRNNQNSLFREDSSWKNISVVRFYLRWMFDDLPCRANSSAEVALYGEAPFQSCRSTLHSKVSFIPASSGGLDCGSSNAFIQSVDEMTLSATILLALRQFYEGLKLFNATVFQSNTFACEICDVLRDGSSELNYYLLEKISINFESHLNEIIEVSRSYSNEENCLHRVKYLLHSIQVIVIPLHF